MPKETATCVVECRDLNSPEARAKGRELPIGPSDMSACSAVQIPRKPVRFRPAGLEWNVRSRLIPVRKRTGRKPPDAAVHGFLARFDPFRRLGEFSTPLKTDNPFSARLEADAGRI
jgi:hypothetical protein